MAFGRHTFWWNHAPICLMFGLSRISGFTTSLLLNLEGIFTAIIAVVFFQGKMQGKAVAGVNMHDWCGGIFNVGFKSQAKFT